MTPETLQILLRRRERTTVEFKEARRDLPRSFFETVCAFLNREGAIERRSL
jgi:ATP-dependent DNA helicase RecG